MFLKFPLELKSEAGIPDILEWTKLHLGTNKKYHNILSKFIHGKITQWLLKSNFSLDIPTMSFTFKQYITYEKLKQGVLQWMKVYIAYNSVLLWLCSYIVMY